MDVINYINSEITHILDKFAKEEKILASRTGELYNNSRSLWFDFCNFKHYIKWFLKKVS